MKQETNSCDLNDYSTCVYSLASSFFKARVVIRCSRVYNLARLNCERG